MMILTSSSFSMKFNFFFFFFFFGGVSSLVSMTYLLIFDSFVKLQAYLSLLQFQKPYRVASLF